MKIEATDAPANPPTKALTAERESEPFLVDNTRPAITNLKATVAPDGSCTVTGVAVDGASNIASLQFSIDAKDWVSFFSADEILDSQNEKFTFATEPQEKGEHTIVVTATDAAGNVGSGKVMVVVK